MKRSTTRAMAPRNQEIIIAVMGPTGSGKSHFIDTLAGTGWSGNSLQSVTSGVADVKLKIQSSSGKTIDLVLVDTPGFDDTHNSDTETLGVIADWMEKKYRKKIGLSGILYLHRITDNRMAGTPLRNLRMFGKLCGGEQEVGKKIVFVTTNWDKLRDHDKGKRRDVELKQYWQPMIDRGARCARFENTRESGSQILMDLIGCSPSDRAVLLQEEMVERDLPLNETEAAQTLYSQYQTLLSQQKTTLIDLERAAKKTNDAQMLADLEAERARVQAELNKTFQEAKTLKIGIAKRFLRFFRKHKVGMELGGSSKSGGR